MLKKQISSFISILVIMLLVFLSNMTFSVLLPKSVLLFIRIILGTMLFLLWKFFDKRKQRNNGNIAFALMVVNLAFIIVSLFTAKFWNLNLDTPAGIALVKFSDSFFISATIIIAFLFNKFRLKDIFITKGKLVRGLLIGMLSFSLMAFLAINNPENPMKWTFIKTNSIWILVFVFSNAFMEELLFRGIFFNFLMKKLKPVLVIFLTAIVFTFSHLQVTYSPNMLQFLAILLVLGVIWGYIIYNTKSLLASILFHAGADLLIILPIFANYGVNL